MSGQANQDFRDARFSAFLHAIHGALLQQPTTLLPFEELRARVFIRGQRDAGLPAVPLDRIIGSEGRYTDFDRLFLPRNDRTRDRWQSISRAQYQDILLPPVAEPRTLRVVATERSVHVSSGCERFGLNWRRNR
jgi:hypothetical protein